MRKLMVILLVFLGLPFALAAQTYSFTEKQWKKLQAKESNVLDSLRGRILSEERQAKTLDSLVRIEDTLIVSNRNSILKGKGFMAQADLKDRDLTSMKKGLRREIDSLNEVLAALHPEKLDRQIARYIDDKLNYPWSSVNEKAISAIDSLMTPDMQRKYAPKKKILMQYEHLYKEVMNVIRNAQDDPMRIRKEQAAVFRQKYLDEMNATEYLRSYKGMIPCLERMIRVFKDILSGHGMNEKTVDFGVLLNYDQILKI
ncbi:MAG: hypothetical protein LKE47_11870 [Prevotella sp.]|jgi:hypothetical protein|nr:hypothetical protein [Prevotella sp.]MCH3971036.1 hypothetical protein [Prevotella sp.]